MISVIAIWISVMIIYIIYIYLYFTTQIAKKYSTAMCYPPLLWFPNFVHFSTQPGPGCLDFLLFISLTVWVRSGNRKHREYGVSPEQVGFGFELLETSFAHSRGFGHGQIHCLNWYCIRTLPRGGMYWVVHPRRPRDFPRPEGNLGTTGQLVTLLPVKQTRPPQLLRPSLYHYDH